jgi:hypothetical protein
MGFKEWLQEGSAGATSQLRQRFPEVPHFVKSQAPWPVPDEQRYQSSSQAKSGLWQAYKAAQDINRENGGRTIVYHSISPPGSMGGSSLRRVPELENVFSYLTTPSRKEISVSVKKGVWNTGVYLEGVGKLLLYFPKDVSTDFTSKRQLIPIAAYAPESSYDEGVIRLSNVRWNKLHVKREYADKFGGMEKLIEIARKYNLQITESHPSFRN